MSSPRVHIQKQLSRRYGGKDYAKWLVVIPPNVVDKLGWGEGGRSWKLASRVTNSSSSAPANPREAPDGTQTEW